MNMYLIPIDSMAITLSNVRELHVQYIGYYVIRHSCIRVHLESDVTRCRYLYLSVLLLLWKAGGK